MRHAQEIIGGAARRIGRERRGSLTAPQQRRNRHRQGREDVVRRAVLGERGEGEPHTLDRRARRG